MSVQTGDVLRHVIEYVIPNASTILNVFYWFVVDQPTGDIEVMLDLLDWTEEVWGPEWASIASSQADIINMAVDVIDPTNGTVIANVGSNAAAVAGTVADQVNPAAVSGYLKADTQFPKTRGSKYIPAIGEGVTESGIFNSSVVTGLLDLLDIYLTEWEGLNAQCRFRPGVPSRSLAAWVAFEGGGSVTDVPAYQRRRKPNVGS